jgi:hypothetical protein
MLGSVEIDREDKRRWYIDWSPMLNGATVSSVAWSHPQGITQSSASNTGQVTSVMLDPWGTVPGNSYRVFCKVTLSTTETIKRSFELVVKDDL